MEPKIAIFSRDKKKKILLPPADPSPPVPVESPSLDLVSTSKDKEKKSTQESHWRSSAIQPINRKKKRNKQEIISMVLSIIGAIMVGVIMGASILSIFFTNEPTYSKNSIDSHLYFPQKNEHQATHQPLKVYRLQAGIFQHQAGAEKKMLALRKQGFAAVMSNQAPYRIYLGVSVDQKGAIALAKDYQEKGIKVYIKEETIPVQKQIDQALLSSIFQRSRWIFQELSQLSVQGISRQDQVSLQPSPKLSEEYQRLLEETQKLGNQLSKEDKEKWSKMIQALDQAVHSVNEAKLHPNSALMWKIQEGLVRYINNYEQLVNRTG